MNPLRLFLRDFSASTKSLTLPAPSAPSQPPGTAPPSPTRPSATLVVADASPITDEYWEICQQLGIQSAAVLEARFEAFLAERAWALFPKQEVEDYLYKICPPGQVVGWQPLTKEDSVFGTLVPYQRLVPLRVLKRIQAIRAHFSPVEASILISNFEASRPDPFAMVVVGTKWWVFDMWDEPGF